MSTLKASRADNYYYPKEFDNFKGTLNQFNKGFPKDSKGNRLKEFEKVKVRYETPFHVRCEKCKNMIAKGVRFNAIREKIGKYFSTPIYEFNFLCHNCGNRIFVETDPENNDYKYAKGAYKIFKTEEATNDVQFLKTYDEKMEYKNNHFKQLEAVQKDLEIKTKTKPIIAKTIEFKKQFKDDFQLHQTMRKKFKKEGQALNAREKRLEGKFVDSRLFKDKNDDKIINLIEFQTQKEDNLKKKICKLQNESIFNSSIDKNNRILDKKLQRLPGQTKEAIFQQLQKQ